MASKFGNMTGQNIGYGGKTKAVKKQNQQAAYSKLWNTYMAQGMNQQNAMAKAKQDLKSGGAGGIAGEYQRAMDEAKAANEQRYQDILGGYEKRYSGAMGLLEGLGTQQRADLNQQFTEQGAQQKSYLAARGLSGTTLVPTMQQGLLSQQQDAMTRLNEALKRERLGYQTGLSADTLQFKERRTDEYPDLNQMIQLSQMQGQSGGGGGGGGLGIFNASMRNSIGAARGYSGQSGSKKNGVATYYPGAGMAQAPRYAAPAATPAASATSTLSPYGPYASGYKAPAQPAKQSYIPKQSWQSY